MAGAFMNLVESSDDLSLQVFVHVNGSSCCGDRFTLLDMLLTEQELSVEVTVLNYVRVSDY
jgi:hypothetical protein